MKLPQLWDDSELYCLEDNTRKYLITEWPGMSIVLKKATIHFSSIGGYGCRNINHLRNINWLRLC